MQPLHDREIEVKFLEIDVPEIIKKMAVLKATDLGEDTFSEIIFYDKELKWNKAGHPFVRLRKKRGGAMLAFKDHQTAAVDGTLELETGVSNWDAAIKILEQLGLVAYRRQEKRCHEFVLDNVICGIDTWPKAPAWLELEGPSEEALKAAAVKLGLDWNKGVFLDARSVLKRYLGEDVGNLRTYTFEKLE